MTPERRAEIERLLADAGSEHNLVDFSAAGDHCPKCRADVVLGTSSAMTAIIRELLAALDSLKPSTSPDRAEASKRIPIPLEVLPVNPMEMLTNHPKLAEASSELRGRISMYLMQLPATESIDWAHELLSEAADALTAKDAQLTAQQQRIEALELELRSR